MPNKKTEEVDVVKLKEDVENLKVAVAELSLTIQNLKQENEVKTGGLI